MLQEFIIRINHLLEALNKVRELLTEVEYAALLAKLHTLIYPMGEDQLDPQEVVRKLRQCELLIERLERERAGS